MVGIISTTLKMLRLGAKFGQIDNIVS